MKKIYYEKKGRRYVPVSEYDSDLLDALPKGAHIVMVYPGGRSTRYMIDPAYGPMIAAGRVAEDAITRAISEASQVRREKNTETPLTPEQKAAWEHLVEVLGERARYLCWESARGVAEAGLKAMQEEANKLMTNPVVKQAFEHFLLIAELAKEDKHGT